MKIFKKFIIGVIVLMMGTICFAAPYDTITIDRATGKVVNTNLSLLYYGSLSVSNGYRDIPVILNYTAFTNIIIDPNLGSTFIVTNMTNHIYVTVTNTFVGNAFHKNIRLITKENSLGNWFVSWNTNTSVAHSKFSYGVIPVNTTNANAESVYSGTTGITTNIMWTLIDNFQP